MRHIPPPKKGCHVCTVVLRALWTGDQLRCKGTGFASRGLRAAWRRRRAHLEPGDAVPQRPRRGLCVLHSEERRKGPARGRRLCQHCGSRSSAAWLWAILGQGYQLLRVPLMREGAALWAKQGALRHVARRPHSITQHRQCGMTRRRQARARLTGTCRCTTAVRPRTRSSSPSATATGCVVRA